MTLKINEDSMTAEVNGTMIAPAIRTGDRWNRQRVATHSQVQPGDHSPDSGRAPRCRYRDDDPFVLAWREELTHG
jgi:hypothetical protein